MPETRAKPYVPDNALQISIAPFEGPMDVLLHLIQRRNVSILDIPIAPICAQYLSWLDSIPPLDLNADYLSMAAWLVRIKARMLLPKTESEACDADEEDPRAALSDRLRTYQRYRDAAAQLAAMPLLERDYRLTRPPATNALTTSSKPQLDMAQLRRTLSELKQRQDQRQPFTIQQHQRPVRQRMVEIMQQLLHTPQCTLRDLYSTGENRSAVVLTLLAILELMRQGRVQLSRDEHDTSYILKHAG